MGLRLYSSSDSVRKSTFLTIGKSLMVCTVLSLFAGLLFSFTYEDKPIENSDSQLHSNDLFTSNPYFVMEEIPGKFRMVKAVFSDHELILRPDMLEYLDTDVRNELTHLVFEKCNKNIRPDGVNMISNEKVPIKNKAMAEVLEATTMEVTRYERVIYRNIYDNLDLEISFNAEGGIHADLKEKVKGAASKFNMKPRYTPAEYNGSQESISLPKSKKSLKIKSNNDKINFAQGKGFKLKNPEQHSDDLSFDITIK